LATIGREPLLTAAEEIELGNQVQAMMRLLEAGEPEAGESKAFIWEALLVHQILKQN
jgi:hypothetical protein